MWLYGENSRMLRGKETGQQFGRLLKESMSGRLQNGSIYQHWNILGRDARFFMK
jgi:hypothetical protein